MPEPLLAAAAVDDADRDRGERPGDRLRPGSDEAAGPGVLDGVDERDGDTAYDQAAIVAPAGKPKRRRTKAADVDADNRVQVAITVHEAELDGRP